MTRILGVNVKRSRRLFALAGSGLFAVVVCWWYVSASSSPAIPSEYQDIRLGMPMDEVNAILASGSFRQPSGPGYSGRQKDEQQTKEYAERRWSDNAKGNWSYRRVTWRDEA